MGLLGGALGLALTLGAVGLVRDLASVLKEGAHGATATPRSRRLRSLLIASEVALSHLGS